VQISRLSIQQQPPAAADSLRRKSKAFQGISEIP
jgi:hypothetical protein